MKYSATYVREGEEILAFYGDHVIAHGPNFAAVEKTAVEYLDSLKKQEDDDIEMKKVKSARYVESPSGLKGEILGNVEGQWGERQMTVRWENGRIARYDGHGAGFKYTAAEAEKPQSALAYLEGLLNEDVGHDRESLTSRIKALDGIVAKVGSVVATGVSAADERKLDKIALQAEAEKDEARQALDHLEQVDAESFSPPAPFDYGVAEQASLGGGSGNWLDETVNEMIAESANQDFEKLLSEEPGQFVAGLDTAALADQGVTQGLALAHITSKTAGITALARGGMPEAGPEPTAMGAPPNLAAPAAPAATSCATCQGGGCANCGGTGLAGVSGGANAGGMAPGGLGGMFGSVEDYHKQFLAKVEMARRDELAYRKTQMATTAKKQAAEEKKDFPDEALFV